MQFFCCTKNDKNTLLITIAVTDYPSMSSWTHIRNAVETISVKTIIYQMQQWMMIRVQYFRRDNLEN